MQSRSAPWVSTSTWMGICRWMPALFARTFWMYVDHLGDLDAAAVGLGMVM